MRSCASLPPSVSETPSSPKHPIGIHAGRSSARSVRQRAGAALHALSSHVLVVVFCGLDWGTRRFFPGQLNYAPNLLNTLVCDQVIRPVMWPHSKMLRVLQHHHSCALPPAMGL